jgi:hypothetical protein
VPISCVAGHIEADTFLFFLFNIIFLLLLYYYLIELQMFLPGCSGTAIRHITYKNTHITQNITPRAGCVALCASYLSVLYLGFQLESILWCSHLAALFCTRANAFSPCKDPSMPLRIQESGTLVMYRFCACHSWVMELSIGLTFDSKILHCFKLVLGKTWNVDSAKADKWNILDFPLNYHHMLRDRFVTSGAAIWGKRRELVCSL